MTKKLNIYNHAGITEADNKAILEAIEGVLRRRAGRRFRRNR